MEWTPGASGTEVPATPHPRSMRSNTDRKQLLNMSQFLLRSHGAGNRADSTPGVLRGWRETWKGPVHPMHFSRSSPLAVPALGCLERRRQLRALRPAAHCGSSPHTRTLGRRSRGTGGRRTRGSRRSPLHGERHCRPTGRPSLPEGEEGSVPKLTKISQDEGIWVPRDDQEAFISFLLDTI